MVLLLLLFSHSVVPDFLRPHNPEGWYRVNRSACEGSKLPTEVFIWNLFMANLSWVAEKYFYSAKQFHFVGSFPSLSFHCLFSLSPTLHTHTYTHTHIIHDPIKWWASSYKDILWNYLTIVKEFIFQIWTGEVMMVRKLFMLKPLKWKLWTDSSLGNRKWTRLWLGLKFISFPGIKRLFDE